MIPWQSVILFLLTLGLMAFFAGVEMAYYSANRLTIEIKKKEEDRASTLLSRFVDAPARFLGMTLIGFNVFLVFFTLQIAVVMHPVWKYLDVKSNLIQISAEIGLATLVVLVLAEFIPRSYFRTRSNRSLTRFAHIIDFFYNLLYPVALFLIDMAEWILKYVFSIRLKKNKEPFKRSDLTHFFQQTDNEQRQERNTQLMENARELPNVRIRQCLVPRKEIVGIDRTATIEDLKQKFVETKLSKLVVFENNIDRITGYVHQLELFKKPVSIDSILLPIPAVPESMSATDLISKFTRERKSIAWVVDEFGGTAGIITMEDVLEELFGEIHDEYDTEDFIDKQLPGNQFLFSGRLELDYLEGKYGLEFGEDDSETLSGFIINQHETIPHQKERIIIGDFEFEIMQVSNTRIEVVKMKKLK